MSKDKYVQDAKAVAGEGKYLHGECINLLALHLDGGNAKANELGQLAKAIIPAATETPSRSQPHAVDSDLL